MKTGVLIMTMMSILLVGCASEKISRAGNSTAKADASGDTALKIVYDNTVYDQKLKNGWGFGCLVQSKGKNILFDTGSDSPTLLSNMQSMGIDPGIVDIVVLSHIHGDHVGGLQGFLQKNSDVKVYVPGSFPETFKEDVRATGAECIDVSGPAQITENIYSTGELGTGIKEQSLVIHTGKGLIVMTGCAHPGISMITAKSKDLYDDRVHLVIGGFHSPPLSVVQDFREMDVEKVCPCHCTGTSAMNAFEKEYKAEFIQGGAGRIIRI